MLNEQLDGQLRWRNSTRYKVEPSLSTSAMAASLPLTRRVSNSPSKAAFKADLGVHYDQPLPDAAQNNVIRVADTVIHAAIKYAVKATRSKSSSSGFG